MISLSIHKKLHAATGDMNMQLELVVNTGELVTLYGPSGSGKTSILRMIAGLLKPDDGVIQVAGQLCFSKGAHINVRPQLRNVGIVFQDYALFPNMSVRENLEYARMKEQSKSIIDELLTLMELEQLSNKRPEVLSGGQKQRVALARALVKKPSILLLDEPLAALDPEMRFKLQDHLITVRKEYNITTLLISHDMVEVIRLSDRVCMLDNGKIVKQGKPLEVLPTGGLQQFAALMKPFYKEE